MAPLRAMDVAPLPASPTPCPSNFAQYSLSKTDLKYGVSDRHRFSAADRVNPAEHEKYGRNANAPEYMTYWFLVALRALGQMVSVSLTHAPAYFWKIRASSIAL